MWINRQHIAMGLFIVSQCGSLCARKPSTVEAERVGEQFSYKTQAEKKAAIAAREAEYKHLKKQNIGVRWIHNNSGLPIRVNIVTARQATLTITVGPFATKKVTFPGMDLASIQRGDTRANPEGINNWHAIAWSEGRWQYLN